MVNPQPQSRLTAATDYGWTLVGRPVRQLHDGTLQLDTSSVPSPRVPCQQCGICTASCQLARETQAFPRRTLALVQLGDSERALRLTDVWQCHGCGDCTLACPNQLDPAGMLADLRRKAIRSAAGSNVIASSLDHWWGIGLAFAVSGGGIILLSGLTGELFPGGSVRYSKLLPHPAIVAVFGVIALGALAVMARGIQRSWSWFASEQHSSSIAAMRACAQPIVQAMTHRNHAACGTERSGALAHGATMFGFLGLLVTTGSTATIVAGGGAHPFELDHPVKLAANLLSLLLIGGSLYALGRRILHTTAAAPVAAFEWFVPLALLSLGLSGLALEVLRILDSPALAYSVYILHLATATLFIALWPYTKMAHAVLRLIALASLRLRQRAPGSSRVAPRIQPKKEWPVA